MSDGSEASGPIQRRPPRTTDGGPPVSGALAIVLALVAVVVGFLILRAISGDDEQQLGIPNGSTDDSPDDQSTASAPPDSSQSTTTTTTLPPLVVDGAVVVVANANGVGGSALRMSTALETGPHFTMGTPANVSDPTPAATSTAYFDSSQLAAQAVAESVARVLGGGVNVIPMPATGPPVTGGDIGDAGVLLMLGTDKADKTLAELNPALATPATNPVLPAATTTLP